MKAKVLWSSLTIISMMFMGCSDPISSNNDDNSGNSTSQKNLPHSSFDVKSYSSSFSTGYYKDTIALDSSIYFTNNSTLADYYQWDFGDGSTSTLTTPTHKYSKTGNYEITLIAINSDGYDTSYASIYVKELAHWEAVSKDTITVQKGYIHWWGSTSYSSYLDENELTKYTATATGSYVSASVLPNKNEYQNLADGNSYNYYIGSREQNISNYSFEGKISKYSGMLFQYDGTGTTDVVVTKYEWSGSESEYSGTSSIQIGNEEMNKDYSCRIDSVVVQSLDASGWDALGGNGDPFFSFYVNGSYLTSTSTKSNVSSSDFPLNYTVKSTITSPDGVSLKIKLIDEDVSDNDEKISETVNLDNYKGLDYITFDYTGYSLVSKIYLTWIEK